MENLYGPNLSQSGNEFMSNNNLNIGNNIENNNKTPNVYNPVIFQTEILIFYFQDIGIHEKSVLSQKW